MVTFSEIAEAADSLSPDEQETLVELLRRRLENRHREQLVRDVADARSEFRQGKSRSATVREIIEEAQTLN
mgnify:CR=1 FL=1